MIETVNYTSRILVAEKSYFVDKQSRVFLEPEPTGNVVNTNKRSYTGK